MNRSLLTSGSAAFNGSSVNVKNKAKAALSVLLLGLISSCGAKTTETLGGESHFLSRCNEVCAEGLSCIEGVCTVKCDAEATCTPWSSSATCTDGAGFGTEVCDVACTGDVDCASLTGMHSCSDGYCRAAFSDGTPGPSGGPTALSGLVGNDYQLESSEGFTPVEGTTVRINIDESDFGFSAGCNGHGGSYTFCDERLCLSDLGSTDIGCDAPRQAQDEWLAEFFTATPSVGRMGDRVTFATEDASLVFLDTEVANPDRSLTGRVWSIDTLISGAAASNSPTQAVPTLEFGQDGSVTVFTSCVQGTGSWDSGIGPPPEGELTLGNIAYPEEPCDESGSTLAHDHIVSVIAQGEVTFTIDETRLTVMRGDIGLGATTE